jgi:transcriptional regulator GlxA family with amidase domain
VAPVFATLVREVSLLKEARGLGLRLAVDALLLEIARTAGSRAAPLSATLAWHPGVERAVGVIRQNPGQSLTVASLARLAGLSAGHLTELFKAHVGCTPHRFILQCRLERARELVESSNLPLTQMAHELGFASSQHLSGAFREAFGCPPRTWKMRSGQSRKSSN